MAPVCFADTVQRYVRWGSCSSFVPTCLFSHRCIGCRGRIFFNAACLAAHGGTFFEGYRVCFTPNIPFTGFYIFAANTCTAACTFAEA
jgi:hypothetical protein